MKQERRRQKANLEADEQDQFKTIREIDKIVRQANHSIKLGLKRDIPSVALFLEQALAENSVKFSN